MRNGAKRLKAGRRRGASAVEFALVLPLLITIVLGCVDFGRFAYTYIAVTNAAREGAYFAAKNPWTLATKDAWRTQLLLTVEDELGCNDPGSAFDPSKVGVISTTQTSFIPKGSKVPVIMPITTDPDGSKRVGVQVSYPFVMLVNWPLLPGNMTLARVVDMRALY